MTLLWQYETCWKELYSVREVVSEVSLKDFPTRLGGYGKKLLINASSRLTFSIMKRLRTTPSGYLRSCVQTRR